MSFFITVTPLVGEEVTIAESSIVYGEPTETGGTLLYTLLPGKTIKETLEVEESMYEIQVLSAATGNDQLFVAPRLFDEGTTTRLVLHQKARVVIIYDTDPCNYQYDLTQPGKEIWTCDGDKTEFEGYMAGDYSPSASPSPSPSPSPS